MEIRAVVQRVSEAKVTVEGKTVGEIGRGLAVLLGVRCDDTEKDMEYLADKILNLRIFDDEDGKMNVSLRDAGGGLLVVSQFTLYGDCRRGRRPGFSDAARPEQAERLYGMFVDYCRERGVRVETGKFRTTMMVEIHNDGPVTILLDSRKEF